MSLNLLRMTSAVLVAALSIFVFLPNDCYCSTCLCSSISLHEKNCCSATSTTCECCHQSAPAEETSNPESSTCQCTSLSDPYIAASAEVTVEKPTATDWFCPNAEFTKLFSGQNSRFVHASTVPVHRSDQPLFIIYCSLLN